MNLVKCEEKNCPVDDQLHFCRFNCVLFARLAMLLLKTAPCSPFPRSADLSNDKIQT